MAAKKKPKKKTVTIKGSKKQKTVTFKAGSLHRALGVPEGEKIPRSKMEKALAGDYGAKAKKQALFAENMLRKGRQTAAKKWKKKASKKR